MGTMTADFTGEVALVTGAAGGMGRAAFDYAGHGARVVMADIDRAGGEETARLVADSGGEGVFVTTDISDPAAAGAMVATTTDRYGALHCAVNAAAIETETAAYTASKHAVLGLTCSAAFDYAGHGIRINAICPGSIDTPMLRQAMERRGRDPHDVADRLSLLGRFGQPDEIAAAALWLCSNGSSFTIGHPLAVDAGYLAR